jgi:hypothetical protein
MGKEGNDDVNDNLRCEVDEYQRTQEGIRNPIEIMENQEKQWREIAHHRHRYICAVTAHFYKFRIAIHSCFPFKNPAYYNTTLRRKQRKQQTILHFIKKQP